MTTSTIVFPGVTELFTVLFSVQLCPPILIAKLAVPLPPGVPLIVNVSDPLPFASVPDDKVAVKPVTPVDVTFLAA